MSSRDRVNALLKKPVQDCTEAELMALQKGSTTEMKRRAFENLQLVAAQYVELYGHKEGIEEMGEDLCKHIARGKHPEGWAGLVRHLVRISG